MLNQQTFEEIVRSELVDRLIASIETSKERGEDLRNTFINITIRTFISHLADNERLTTSITNENETLKQDKADLITERDSLRGDLNVLRDFLREWIRATENLQKQIGNLSNL